MLHFGRQRGRGDDRADGFSELPDLDEEGCVVRRSDHHRGAQAAVEAAAAMAEAAAAQKRHSAPTGGNLRFGRGRGRVGDAGGDVLGLDEDGHVIREVARASLPDGRGVGGGGAPAHPGAKRVGAGAVAFGRFAYIGSGHAIPPPGHRGAEGVFDEDGAFL